MKISIIVPNHGRDISKLLESIERSTYPADKIETIVVDMGKERSYQRNYGIKKATGKAYLILDSDQSISPNLLSECVVLMHRGYSAIYIPEIIIADSFFGKVRKFEREFYTGTSIDVPRFVLASCCPLFDDTMNGPEDSDWGNRIEGKRTISKSPLFHHDDISIWQYFKKKAYYTKSMAVYKNKHPNDKCLTFSYRCFGVFVENCKWRKILKHPILFICIMMIVFLRGIIYISTPKTKVET